jgi:hypothetical protein
MRGARHLATGDLDLARHLTFEGDHPGRSWTAMKSGSPIGDHTELRQGGRTVQRGLDADGDVRGYLRGNHDPGPQSSRIGVSEGGEEPQKGTALSRERMPLPRWSDTL